MIRKVEQYGPYILCILGLTLPICFPDYFELSKDQINLLTQHIVTMSSIFLSFDGVMLGLLYTLLEKVKQKIFSKYLYQDLYKYTIQSVCTNFISIILIIINDLMNNFLETNLLNIFIMLIAAIISFNFRIIIVLSYMVKLNIIKSKYTV